jgi:HSP20 family protein
MNATLNPTENRAGNGSGTQPVRYLTPPSNIWETGDGYLLQVEMPGVSKEGLELTVENNELTITGRRAESDLKADVVYRESRPLDYRRVFELDPSIDTGRNSAKMEQGILTLTLPKAERVKPRKITVTD